MRLLEGHILQQVDGIYILLADGAAAGLLLTYYYTLRLWLKQHTTGGDGAYGAILGLAYTDARETYLQDSDALQLDFLTHLEEVLHGLAQFLQHGLDITLLYRSLTLDKVGNLVGAHKVVVVHGLGVILAVGLCVVLVVVL